MQIVILCGGLGTRLASVTERVPKSLAILDGKPFLQYQVELLRSRGITDIVLCIGYLGQQIRRFLDDGTAWGVRIEYSDEGERLLGTAGAIKRAEPLLKERFFVMYGDSYLPLDFENVGKCFEERGRLAMMVVYRNDNRYDTSNVILDGDLVQVYDKKSRLPDMVYIDAGVSVLRKEVLGLIPPDEVYTLEALYQGLIQAKKLAAYETRQRFYEIGSPEGLEEFRNLVAQRGALPC